ncbi:MAG: cbb3-type cytochrome c oxidase subunit 3 [Pseudomonas sp.]|uniref:cbb3-type cytochrome oxidase subunit 3 n=1 Tax=Pseudomonas sp. TaxID=306 RepID=UPI0027368CBD|nr:cbb3-type cytochrome c oxidase subunit 3 [Pseudomonas sp.]MDP3845028.1 cbb3-type cytochrome c oxidase subunit 3 [Pseudomonas sp.]
MDVGTLRGLGTLLVVIAFTCVTLWAYSGKRKNSFAAAANLPFADDTEAEKREERASRSNNT